MLKIIWNDIFLNGEISDNSIDNKTLCAIALTAWGNCHFEKRPENFGKGMVAIGNKLGIVPIPENLLKYADNFKNP